MGHLYHSYVRLEGKPYVSSPASFASSTVRRGRWRAADSAPLGSKGFPLDESWNFTSRSTSKASCQVFPGFPWFPEKKGFHWGFDTGYKDKCIYIYVHILCIYIYDNFIGDIIWFMWEYAGYITTRCDSGVSEFTPKGPGCDLDLGMHPQRP
jgi:hypothetical protein